MNKMRNIKPLKRYGIVCCSFLMAISASNLAAHDCEPAALIGGLSNEPYAALVDEDGNVSKLPGLPPTGLIYRVAINSSGEGLIGGTNNLDAYAAVVSPCGDITPVAGLIAPGEIYSVAKNQAGAGIIGGGHLISNIPYAALVSRDGIATSLDMPNSGLMYSVAINNSGEGLVGGIGTLNTAYAGLVSPNGTVTDVPGLPVIGAIYWVAINDSGSKFIGGQNISNVYAAFVSSDLTVTPIQGLPQGLNYSVALNASGNAIMGGQSLTLPYASLVSSEGNVTTITGLPASTGKIYSVAINDSGAGLLAGFSATGPYGAFVAPDGSLTPLKGLPAGAGPNDFLDGIALDPSGIALVGGEANGVPFAAFAAPNGALTYLSGLPDNGAINTISLRMLSNLVPKSIGPFNSYSNTQFALSNALTQHCMTHGKKAYNCAEECCFALNNSSVWLSTFGNYVRENAKGWIPKYTNEIAGVMLGFDYKCVRDVVFGAGISYAYNFVRYSEGKGNAKINQESAVIYASVNKSHFYMNVALWGGAFQTTHKRHSLLSITSKANPDGWNLSPHIELSSPFVISRCQMITVDPFVSFDWNNIWQSRFKERGDSGFNIVLKDQYASMLRSEIGVRFFETFQYCWGQLIIEEKGSYVNRNPFQGGRRSASFIGSISSFDVETFSRCTQNLGTVQLHVECLPTCWKNLYGSLDYQGEFGSAFQSNMLTFSIGMDF